MEFIKTKAAAKKAVIVQGFTVHFDTGESGDGGYGSREYFTKLDAQKNEFGFPLQYATISKVGRLGWHISVFGK